MRFFLSLLLLLSLAFQVEGQGKIQFHQIEDLPVQQWSDAKIYSPGEIVVSSGTLWVCLLENEDENPGSDNSLWMQIAGPDDIRGWNAVNAHATGDFVKFRNELWVNVSASSTGQQPDLHPSVWRQVTSTGIPYGNRSSTSIDVSYSGSLDDVVNGIIRCEDCTGKPVGYGDGWVTTKSKINTFIVQEYEEDSGAGRIARRAGFESPTLGNIWLNWEETFNPSNADGDIDPNNELQTLSVSEQNLTISNGNTVSLPVPPGDNLGSHVATQAVNFSNFRGVNAAEPSNPADIATKNYVDLKAGRISLVNFSPNTIVGTSAASVIASHTIPANTLLNNAKLNWTHSATYLNNSGGSSGISLILKINGVTVYDDFSGNIPTSGFGREIQFKAELVRTSATTAVLFGQLILDNAGGNSTGFGNFNSTSFRTVPLRTIEVTADFTTPVQVDIFYEHGIGNANVSISNNYSGITNY